MNEDLTVIPPVIRQKRKYTRRKKVLTPRAAPPASKPVAEFAGLTATNCCRACSPAGCVISGTQICGHPNKGAQINRLNPDAVERLNRARKMLGIKEMEQRYAVG